MGKGLSRWIVRGMKFSGLLVGCVGLMLFLRSCDSAVDTDEYVREKSLFHGATIQRVTIYRVPYTGHSTYWKEKALVRKGFPAARFDGLQAQAVWDDLSRRVDQDRIKDRSSSDKLSLAIVVENTSGEKYFADPVRLHVGKEGRFVFVNDHGDSDSDWWFEAKSTAWDGVLRPE